METAVSQTHSAQSCSRRFDAPDVSERNPFRPEIVQAAATEPDVAAPPGFQLTLILTDYQYRQTCLSMPAAFQHVLPRGFHKVRYFGLWHPSKRDLAARARLLLQLERPVASLPTEPTLDPAATGDADRHDRQAATASHTSWPCPHCRHGHLVLIRKLTPRMAMGP